MPSNARRSVTTKTLLPFALGLLVVVCGFAAFADLHARRSIQRRTSDELTHYAEQRLAREQAPFASATRVGERFRHEYLKRLGLGASVDLDARFGRLAIPWTDGTLRNRRRGFNPDTNIGIFVGPQQSIDGTFKQRMLVAAQLLESMGPLAVEPMPDLYVTMPNNVIAIYWPGVAWTLDMDSNFDMRAEPYFAIADKASNPHGEQRWSGIYYDTVSKAWMMSFATPIWVADEHVATVGQDLLLSEFFTRMDQEALPGTRTVVIRRADSTLVFAPGLMDRLLASKGALPVAQSEEPELIGLATTVSADVQGVQLVEADDALVAWGRIAGPDWALAVLYPKQLMAPQVAHARRLIAASALTCYLACLLLAFGALRWCVVRPLQKLLAASPPAGEAAGNELAHLEQILQGLAAAGGPEATPVADLDHRVNERTSELQRRVHEMRLVLDTVAQGLVSIELNGTMGKEPSRVVGDWLGAVGAATSFPAYVAGSDPVTAAWLGAGLQSIANRTLPRELTLSLLPTQLRAGERILGIQYAPIMTEGELAGLLITLTDVTTETTRAQFERQQRQVGSLLQALEQNLGLFCDFFEEATRLVERLRTPESEQAALADVLALRDGTQAFGIVSVSGVCAAVVEAGALTEAEHARIAMEWARAQSLTRILLPGIVRREEFSADEFGALKLRIEQAAPVHAILESLELSFIEPVEHLFRHLGDQVVAHARRLGIGELRVENRHHHLQLQSKQWSTLWGGLGQLARNAVDQGLDTAEERALSKKTAVPTITFESLLEGDSLVLAIEDDGRGVDWAKIAERASRLGLPQSTQTELEQAFFWQDVPENDTSPPSHRGALAALMTDVEARGGSLKVRSTPGRGTRIECRMPVERRSVASVPETVVLAGKAA